MNTSCGAYATNTSTGLPKQHPNDVPVAAVGGQGSVKTMAETDGVTKKTLYPEVRAFMSHKNPHQVFRKYWMYYG